MESINYLVVTFFASATVLLAYLGYLFYKVNKQPMKHFGSGLLFVSLAFLIWTYIVLFQPENMTLATTAGVVPFLCSFVLFMLTAVSGVKVKYRAPLIAISSAILAAFIVARFFLYSSDPGFSLNGFFEFNVDPVVLYFYAMILSFNFIPAVYVVGRHIKHDLLRTLTELGLTLVAVGLIIMVTNTDENLQIINGIGIAIGLIAATGAATIYGLNKKTLK